MNNILVFLTVIVVILLMIYLRHRHIRDVILVRNPNYSPVWYDFGYGYWGGDHYIRNRGFDGGHAGPSRFSGHGGHFGGRHH